MSEDAGRGGRTGKKMEGEDTEEEEGDEGGTEKEVKGGMAKEKGEVAGREVDGVMLLFTIRTPTDGRKETADLGILPE